VPRERWQTARCGRADTNTLEAHKNEVLLRSAIIGNKMKLRLDVGDTPISQIFGHSIIEKPDSKEILKDDLAAERWPRR
jgi:hypothetical protein